MTAVPEVLHFLLPGGLLWLPGIAGENGVGSRLKRDGFRFSVGRPKGLPFSFVRGE